MDTLKKWRSRTEMKISAATMPTNAAATSSIESITRSMKLRFTFCCMGVSRLISNSESIQTQSGPDDAWVGRTRLEAETAAQKPALYLLRDCFSPSSTDLGS